MLRRLKNWCAQERVGRVEEGTSQDMCPTNGDALILFCVMSMVGCCVGLVVLLN